MSGDGAHTKREDDDHSYDFVEFRYAFALLGRKHIEEALDLLRKETVESPEDPAVWQNLGDAQVRANHPEQAITAYKKSIALGATQEWPHEGLAKAYFNLKQYSEAETELKAAIALYGAQYHSGEPTDSFHAMMKKMQEATHQEPSLAKVHCQLAQVYVGAKEYAKAVSELDGAEQANSDNKINYEYLRAHIYEESGQLDKANALRSQASKEVRDEMKKAPKDADMEAYLAYPESLFISFEEDDLASAQEIIAFYAPLPAASLKAMDMLTLGMAYCAVGKPDQCSIYVESAFRVGEKLNRAESHHKLAEALSEAHDSRGALEHFQAAYELDPINTTYRLDYQSAKVDPLADAASGILGHMNSDHVPAMILLAQVHAGLDATEATMMAVDRLGFHLRLKTADGMKGTRINFLREVQNSDEARKVLVEMVRAAEPKV